MVVHAAARCRSDEFEVHVEGERPVGGQLVGRVDGGSLCLFNRKWAV